MIVRTYAVVHAPNKSLNQTVITLTRDGTKITVTAPVFGNARAIPVDLGFIKDLRQVCDEILGQDSLDTPEPTGLE